jgi:hypothetical protein
MKKSTLIDLLSKLSHKEIKEFNEYVRSPFFNKNQSIIKLYDYLKVQYPEFDKDKVEKKFVYSKLFPKIKYNDGFMRTLIFNLCSLAEDYLSYIRYKGSYYKDKINLLYELNDRHIDHLFERNIHAISKKLDEQVIRDIDYYDDKYNVENEKYTYYFRTKPDAYEKTFKEVNMTAMMNYLLINHLTSAINDYIRLLNFKNMYNVDLGLGQFESFFKAIDPKLFRDVPCVIISYYGMMLFSKEDDISNFYTIKTLLEKYENSLDKNHVYNICQNLINYCNRNMNKGHPELLRERFEIYKLGIDKKILPIHDKSNFRFFTNIVETALRLKEFEWVKKFMKDHKSLLPPEIRDNTYNYSLAMYEFAAGNFENALELLSKIRYNDVYHKLKCKSLLTMLYYELDYSELLLSHIDTFNHFIINDKLLNKERKKYYSVFIKYVKRIENLKHTGYKDEAENLKKMINADQTVYYKDWLTEKLDEIIK